MNDSSERHSELPEAADPKPSRLRFNLSTLVALVFLASVILARYGHQYRLYLQDKHRIVPTDFDVSAGKNVLWKQRVGSVAYGAPVVADGRVFVGTNNASGYLPRYPSDIDLGVLLCFRASDGQFLWQDSNLKLPTGRLHDWPLQGVTSTPRVEKDRLWYVSNRCEVVCLDTEGFYDNEDDGQRDEVSESADQADTVWRFDMMKELGVSPHNASCSRVAVSPDAVFVVTGQGVDESHVNIPDERPASFLALEKKTGKFLWSDNSPGRNILHGQWGSPTYAVLGGVAQVIFPGGDGWLYSFDPKGTADGQSKLLWKFDCNPKDSAWILGGRGTRNNLLTPVTVYQGRVYIVVGQDPEHGEGPGHLWCIDPTRRGDVSSELVYNQADPATPIPHRRLMACDPQKGDFTKPNPNSAVIWHYTGTDLNADGKRTFEEQMHRSLSQVAIKNGLAFVTDYSGLVHCVDAATGQGLWTYDLLASCWSTPLISAQHVYVTDEDGDVAVFRLSGDPEEAMPLGAPVSESQVLDAAFATPCSANNVLYVVTRHWLYAIADPRQRPAP